MKIFVTYIAQAFDVKLVDKKHETERFAIHLGMIGRNKIDMAFTKPT